MWSFIFTAFWSGIKAFFGKSDQERLGIAETQVKEQAKVLQEVANANRIDAINDQLTADALKLRTSQYKRPG